MFTREDTKAIKGTAVVLMLLHHLAGFKDRYPMDFEGFKSPLWHNGFIKFGYLGALAMSCKICVSLFFFLGGYGMYKQYEKGKYTVSKALLALYKSYWKVFCIFVPIALIFFRRKDESISSLCRSYIIGTPREYITEIVKNLFGFSWSFNGEWWFFASYLCVIPLGYLFVRATHKNKGFTVDMFWVMVADILIRNVFPGITRIEAFSGLEGNFFYAHFFEIVHYSSTFFAGIVFAKYDKIEKVKSVFENMRFRFLIGFLGCFLVLYIRWFIVGDIFDVVHSAVFVISASVMFDGFKIFKKVFAFLGKHSTNMWLIHSFYCYYFYEATKIVYKTRNVWVDLLILIAMSLLTSIILELLYKLLSKLLPIMKKIFFKKPKVVTAVTPEGIEIPVFTEIPEEIPATETIPTETTAESKENEIESTQLLDSIPVNDEKNK